MEHKGSFGESTRLCSHILGLRDTSEAVGSLLNWQWTMMSFKFVSVFLIVFCIIGMIQRRCPKFPGRAVAVANGGRELF